MQRKDRPPDLNSTPLFSEPEMIQRVERVRVLLDTLDDYLPGPSTVHLASPSGIAEGKRVPCDHCRRTGKVTYDVKVAGKPVILPCAACDGTGWRRRRAGDEAWDEYVEEKLPQHAEDPLPVAVKALRNWTTQELEAGIARGRQMELQRAGIHYSEKFAWEARREQQEREGSYRELRRLLGQLRRECPELAAALSLSLAGLPYERTAALQSLQAKALTWLAERMPKRIRVPFEDLERSRERKRTAVELWDAGARSLTAIAKASGQARAKVKKALVQAGRLKADKAVGAVMVGA